MLIKISKLVGSKLKILKLFILIFIGAIIELLSIGAILPALFLFADNPGNKTLETFIKFFPSINLGIDEKYFSLILLNFLLVVFTFKFLYLMFLTYYQAVFANNVRLNLAQNFLKKYLTANYEFHIKNNSAFLIRNINNEIEIFLKSVFVPLLICAMELIIFACLIAFLLFFNFKSTILILATLSILLIIYIIVFNKRFLSWGKARQYNDGMKLKFLTQSLHFAKIIKFINKEDFFIKKYVKYFNQSLIISKKFSVMYVFPRQFLEFFLVLCVVLFSTYLLNNNEDLHSLFATLSVYIVLAYRLIPSVNRLSTNFQSISTGKEAFKKVIEVYESKLDHDINLNDKDIKNNFKEQIEIKGLSFAYDNKNKILDNLNFKITKGEFIGIVGGSGSGKSTLVDLLLGIFKPQDGNIYLDGHKFDHNENLNLNIGYVPQESFILDDTLINNIAFGFTKEEINDDKLNKAIELSNLSSFVKTLPEGLETKLGEKGTRMSGGQRQRVSIARAIYTEPEILILDEATSGLDIETEKKILEDLIQIKKLNTILLISHRKESMLYCDKIFEIKNKNIRQIK